MLLAGRQSSKCSTEGEEDVKQEDEEDPPADGDPQEGRRELALPFIYRRVVPPSLLQLEIQLI